MVAVDAVDASRERARGRVDGVDAMPRRRGAVDASRERNRGRRDAVFTNVPRRRRTKLKAV